MVPSVLLVGEDGDRGDRGRPADVVRQRDSRAVDLILGFTAKLVEEFVALRHAGAPGGWPFAFNPPLGLIGIDPPT